MSGVAELLNDPTILTYTRVLHKIITSLARAEGWRANRLPCDYLVLDTETTGFSKTNDRILQVGMMLVRDCKPAKDLWDSDHKALYLKWTPDVFIGKESAMEVHGITPEVCAAKGAPPADVMQIIKDTIEYARGNGMMIVGHNMISFDAPFITQEMYRAGIKHEFYHNEIVDTGLFVKAMQLGMLPGGDRIYDYGKRVMDMRSRAKWSLDRFCIGTFRLDQLYGISAERAHDAGYDCYITSCLITVINALLDELEKRGDVV